MAFPNGAISKTRNNLDNDWRFVILRKRTLHLATNDVIVLDQGHFTTAIYPLNIIDKIKFTPRRSAGVLYPITRAFIGTARLVIRTLSLLFA